MVAGADAGVDFGVVEAVGAADAGAAVDVGNDEGGEVEAERLLEAEVGVAAEVGDDAEDAEDACEDAGRGVVEDDDEVIRVEYIAGAEHVGAVGAEVDGVEREPDPKDPEGVVQEEDQEKDRDFRRWAVGAENTCGGPYTVVDMHKTGG